MNTAVWLPPLLGGLLIGVAVLCMLIGLGIGQWVAASMARRKD